MTHDDSQINDTPETELDSFDLVEETTEEEIVIVEDDNDDAQPGIADESDLFETEK